MIVGTGENRILDPPRREPPSGFFHGMKGENMTGPHRDDEPSNPETNPDPIPAHTEDPAEDGDALTPDDADEDEGDEGKE